MLPMAPRKLLVAASLALLGLGATLLEGALVHTDDGCVVETHCNACLLRLRTPVVATVAISVRPTIVLVERLAATSAPSRQDATPRRLAPRGPPPA
jgi:hypothetical protein